MQQGRFRAFRQAGVTRLSIGVQSFNDALLGRIGRVHDAAQARAAFRMSWRRSVVASEVGADRVGVIRLAMEQDSRIKF